MTGVADRGVTSVIVVAADSGPLLAASIESALLSRAPVEVVLVDNASCDGEPARVRAMHASDRRLRVLPQSRNIGFGPACNRGAAAATGDALLFLNPDCTIEPDTIASLRAIAAADPGIGVLGVEVLSPDGRPARGNRRREPTLRRAVMTMTGLARFESRWPAFAGVEMPDATQRPALERVEAVSGACVFATRRAFEAIGGFDEGYFLHVEDLDLCRRARDAGYGVAIAHTLRAVHAQGGSSRRRPLFVSWHKHRGMWRYFAKFDPAARNPIARGLVVLAIWTHFAVTAPLHWARGLAGARPHAQARSSGAGDAG